MSDISGELYDGQTSRHWPAMLKCSDGGELRFIWEGGSSSYLLDVVKVSSRLGNTPRYFSFPDGWKFETRDNDGVDTLLRKHKQYGWSAFVHRLESRWHYVIASLLLVVAFIWGMLQYGLPAAAEVVAYQLPPDITGSLSEETLGYFDEHLFEPSELSQDTQVRLQTLFTGMTGTLDSGFHFELKFRKGGEQIGANAFALPSGTVVMTDELIRLAENDEELAAILAHELGHVVLRHSLRQILHNSVLTLFVTYATGDVSSAAVALPMLLVQLGYSRKFERDADRYAYEYLLNHSIEPEHFASILTRIDQEHQLRSEQAEQKGKSVKIFEYLSTHPDTEERVKLFRGTQ